MDPKSRKNWVKHIYKKSFLDENKKIDINYVMLNSLINKVPQKFRDYITIKNIGKLNNEVQRYINSSLVELWGMDDIFTIENSLISKGVSSKQQFLAEAKIDFENMRLFGYELSFKKSIDEHELARMELRELNKFFETGKCNSMAIHSSYSSRWNNDFTEQELYEYYLLLLRGEYEPIFSYVEELNKYITMKKMIYEAGDMASNELNQQLVKPTPNKEWNLAVRIQALFWIKVYLNSVVKTKNFTEIKVSFPEILESDLAENYHGFIVHNPEKTIPVMYEKLVYHGLIDSNGLENFKKVFVSGEGYIDWIGKQNQLGYFIQRLQFKGIISNFDFFKTATAIFHVKGKHVADGNLRSGAKQIEEKSKESIDEIIDEILTVYLQ